MGIALINYGLSASTAVGITGGVLFVAHAAHFLDAGDACKTLLRRIHVVANFAMAGMIVSSVTGSIIPLVALSLVGSLVAMDFLQANNIDEKLMSLAWAVNTIASGVLLYIQPSIYHIVCLGLNTSILWIPKPAMKLSHFPQCEY